MELRYRPDDLFCKPLCGERHRSTAVLIKVTRRRKKHKGTCLFWVVKRSFIMIFGASMQFPYHSLCLRTNEENFE